MNRHVKRETAYLWPKKPFELIREAARHKTMRKGHGEMNALKRLMLTPAVPHSKGYGR